MASAAIWARYCRLFWDLDLGRLSVSGFGWLRAVILTLVWMVIQLLSIPPVSQLGLMSNGIRNLASPTFLSNNIDNPLKKDSPALSCWEGSPAGSVSRSA